MQKKFFFSPETFKNANFFSKTILKNIIGVVEELPEKVLVTPFKEVYGKQILFQDPVTSYMERIIDLHHEIFFYLIILSIFVLWFLIRINFLFKYEITLVPVRPSRVTHNTKLEIL